MGDISIDRARSAFQQMTNARLVKACDRFGIATERGGRRMTKKQMAAALMQCDAAVEEYGRKHEG
ncbi:MAG: hypothetical protein IJ111_05850 [Eggerthellaceae bacterium]|nr:hypothetical protein [Eggerthellaceae bacterium]